MSLQNGLSGLSDKLLARVLGRLGFSNSPSADISGLRALYAAWCGSVPFDNVSKMLALREPGGGALPGGHAEEFFEHWLSHGAGGTCWPTSNALVTLARSLGFEAHRVVRCMRDLGVINHASVRVKIEGRDWLVDSSLLCNVPLPLDQNRFIHDDPAFAVEVEPVDRTHVIWADTPPNSDYLPCRICAEPASHAHYLASYEASRKRSPFNQRLYARRNHPGEFLVLLGSTRFSKTAKGLTIRELSPEGVCQALREDIGLSDCLIQKWVQSGSLDASFEAPAAPEPPPVTRKPPSQR